jgi:hypothetical protein
MALSPFPTFSQGPEAPLLAPAFDPSSIDQQAMMENMQDASSPAIQHEMMDWLAGSWEATTRIWMGGSGGQAMETKGSATSDLIMDGRTLVFYGEMDEPMLEVHGRTVKYVMRTVDADTYVMEVHDLHIGLDNTKVMETEYRRRK